MYGDERPGRPVETEVFTVLEKSRSKVRWILILGASVPVVLIMFLALRRAANSISDSLGTPPLLTQFSVAVLATAVVLVIATLIVSTTLTGKDKDRATLHVDAHGMVEATAQMRTVITWADMTQVRRISQVDALDAGRRDTVIKLTAGMTPSAANLASSVESVMGFGAQVPNQAGLTDMATHRIEQTMRTRRMDDQGRREVVIPLAPYESNWREGRLGELFATYRPDLLKPPPDPKPGSS